MGFWDKLGGEFIDIIEWTDDSPDTMVWKFERFQNEIKYGAKLTVRESQKAVFINEGQLADVFSPGMYTLETSNMPILSTLNGWKYGFNSPFKVDVYFVSMRHFTDLKWGTKNPLMLRDPEFGPVRLRAFGTYAVRVEDAGKFVKEIVGTDSHFTTDEITDQLRNLVVTRFADALGESKIPVLDLASNYNEISEFVTKQIAPEFSGYGIELTKLLVENISLPPEVEKALDTRSSMGIIGDMNTFTRYQAANAIPDVAKNPGAGGLAAGGMGMGMGFGLANQMGNAFQPQQQSSPQAPPPIPQAVSFFVVVNGKQTGPYPVDMLRQQAAAGQLKADSLVWRQGMVQWTAAGQVPELAGIFPPAPPTPPPVPPQG